MRDHLWVRSEAARAAQGARLSHLCPMCGQMREPVKRLDGVPGFYCKRCKEYRHEKVAATSSVGGSAMDAEAKLARVKAAIESRRTATQSMQVRWFCDTLLSFIAERDGDDQ